MCMLFPHQVDPQLCLLKKSQKSSVEASCATLESNKHCHCPFHIADHICKI